MLSQIRMNVVGQKFNEERQVFAELHTEFYHLACLRHDWHDKNPDNPRQNKTNSWNGKSELRLCAHR